MQTSIATDENNHGASSPHSSEMQAVQKQPNVSVLEKGRKIFHVCRDTPSSEFHA
jgi:hypothetical protein